MNHIICSGHGLARMQQRGIRERDVRLIQQYGTRVDNDTWLMRNRDARLRIQALKREIQILGRLANRKVVIRDGRVVTAYTSRRIDQKRALRRGRQNGFSR